MKALLHQKIFSINFSKAKTKFCLSLHDYGDNSDLFFNGKGSISSKQIIKLSTFQISFVLEAYLITVKAEEVSLKGNVYDFSLDYDAIDKSDILNTHKFLMVKINIK